MKSGEVREVEKFVVKPDKPWSSRLMIIPGSYRILDIEREMVAKSGVWLLALRRFVKALEEQLGIKYVFIDLPATLGVLSRMVLGAVERLPLCGGVVFNRLKSKKHLKIAMSIRAEIEGKRLYGKYPIPVYSTYIYDRIVYTYALEEHVPVCKKKDKQANKELEGFFNEFYDYVIDDKVRRMVEGSP